MIEHIAGERAFFISDLKAIVIADLHIGYERELREKGIIVPSQTEDMRKRLSSLVRKYNAEKIIIVGDLKHEITGFAPELYRFFDDIDAEIILAKGNHDGKIEDMVDFKVYPSEGFRLGNYGFFHGHSWPDTGVMKAPYIFMGHLHPEIELQDSLLHRHRYPCHLVGELSSKGEEKYGNSPKIFVIAAFNKLVGASIVKPIGPLLKNGMIEKFEVYLLNGAYLGKYPYTEFSGSE